MGQPDIRGLDLPMLRTFDALLREGSVSRAASRLFLSQPAVSASLKRLREVFGDPLFTRTSHGIVPTPRALALAPRVEAVLHEMHKLMSLEQAFDPATSDRILRITGSDHTCRVMLPLLCAELTRLGSRMRLSWELADYGRLTERLRRGDVDVGLHPRLSPASGVESTLLYGDSYVAVARHGHPALETQPISLDAFCDAPHVVLGQTRSVLDDTVDQALARKGRQRLVQAAVSTFSQMVELMCGDAHSALIAVFPQRVARHYAAQLASAALPVELPDYRLYVCWAERSNADPAVLWLRDEILRHGHAMGAA